MKYTTILFDLDDTLLDTIGNAKETLEEIYIDYDINRFYGTYQEFAHVYFPYNNMLWEMYSLGKIDKPTLLKERFLHPFKNIEEITEDMAAKMNQDFLGRVKCKNRVIEGTIEILEYLKPKYKMHILSNGFSEMQYIKMQSAGVDTYFDKVILSDVVGVNKPHPDIFEFALSEIRATKDETIMIGDNFISDIKGAEGVGMDQIWFNPKGTKPAEFLPTYTIGKLEELKSIL